MKFGEVTIGPEELHMMEKMTITIFEILEKAWSSQNCSLIDMKIEFGVTTTGGLFTARNLTTPCLF